jgi:hypothetical protein
MSDPLVFQIASLFIEKLRTRTRRRQTCTRVETMPDDLPKVWPPAPLASALKAPDKADAPTTGPVEVPACPTCNRKLLSVRSVLCNWCGAVIGDDEYQQRAAEERAMIDASERERIAAEIAETAKLGLLGRIKRAKNREPRTTTLADYMPDSRS